MDQQRPRIAIDAMGGDEGVSVMVAGAAKALNGLANQRFFLVGDEAKIHSELAHYPQLQPLCEIRHTSGVVLGEDRPSQALRKSKKSSMGLAIEAVKSGECGAAVSGGNTGALMAIAKIALRTMPGIDRPALAALLPTLSDTDLVMLDLGANTECDSRNLVQFAVMGAIYSHILYGFERPRVRLLNIGTEDMKGTDALRIAAARLRKGDALPMDFQGFTEADKLSRGDVDVVVTDGFSGNVALKALEGTARFVADLLKRSFQSSLRSKFGFLISRPATELLRYQLDPNNHNGAVFLGLNGVVVKSHGSASPVGVANAIGVAARLAEDNITARITEVLEKFDGDSNGSHANKSHANGQSVEGDPIINADQALKGKSYENILADRPITSSDI